MTVEKMAEVCMENHDKSFGSIAREGDILVGLQLWLWQLAGAGRDGDPCQEDPASRVWKLRKHLQQEQHQ